MQYNKHNLTPTNHSKINPKHSDMHDLPSLSATLTVGILQYNPIQSAISRNLIGQIFGTE